MHTLLILRQHEHKGETQKAGTRFLSLPWRRPRHQRWWPRECGWPQTASGQAKQRGNSSWKSLALFTQALHRGAVGSSTQLWVCATMNNLKPRACESTFPPGSAWQPWFWAHQEQPASLPFCGRNLAGDFWLRFQSSVMLRMSVPLK